MIKFLLQRYAIFLSLIFLNSFSSKSQVTWAKWYGGPQGESSRRVIVSSDGEYYITAGHTYSYGNGGSDIYVIKIDRYGNTIWKKTYGGSNDEFAHSIFETYGGHYIIAGSTKSYGAGNDDAYLIKIDTDGNVIWSKTYGGYGAEIARDAIKTSDGGYALAGYSNSSGTNGYFDAFVVKTNNNGDVEWSRKIGGASYDAAYSIKQTGNGDFVLLGETFSFGSGQSDFYLIKLNTNGDFIWSKTFGGGNVDEGKHLQILDDGSIITIGDTYSYGAGDSDLMIYKLNSSGEPLWVKYYGGGGKEVGKTIEPTPDGGFIIAAIIRNAGTDNPDFWLVKLDSNGTYKWDKRYGGSNHEHAYDAKPTDDGGYIITGHTIVQDVNKEDIHTFKVDSQGNINWDSKDAAISKLNSPKDGDCEKSNTIISTEVSNHGNATISNVVVNLEITGDAFLNAQQTINGSIGSGENKTVDFVQTINTLGGGSYTIKLYTSYPEDVFRKNDTLIANITIHEFSENPVVVSGFNCGPGEVILSANASDEIFWYSSLTSNNIKGTGNQFTTPFLNQTSTYYAQAGNVCPSSRIEAEARIITTTPPEVISGQNCGPGQVTLSASNSIILNWYQTEAGTTPIATGSTFITPFLNNTTIYYVEGGDSCPSPRVAATAYILPLPDVNLGNDTTLESGTILLDAGAGFSSYLWNDNTQNQTLLASQTGHYWVMVEDSNYCSFTDSIKVDINTSIEAETFFNNLKLFPNPTTGTFEISFNNTLSNDAEINLLNSIGQVVYKDLVLGINGTYSHKINISGLSKGNYFIRISSNQYSITKKVVLN